MPITVRCPTCGLKYQVPDALAGKKAKCHHGHVFILKPSSRRRNGRASRDAHIPLSSKRLERSEDAVAPFLAERSDPIISPVTRLPLSAASRLSFAAAEKHAARPQTGSGTRNQAHEPPAGVNGTARLLRYGLTIFRPPPLERLAQHHHDRTPDSAVAPGCAPTAPATAGENPFIPASGKPPRPTGSWSTLKELLTRADG